METVVVFTALFKKDKSRVREVFLSGKQGALPVDKLCSLSTGR